MESFILILSFIIVFGGIGYVLKDMFKHFDTKVNH